MYRCVNGDVFGMFALWSARNIHTHTHTRSQVSVIYRFIRHLSAWGKACLAVADDMVIVEELRSLKLNIVKT